MNILWWNLGKARAPFKLAQKACELLRILPKFNRQTIFFETSDAPAVISLAQKHNADILLTCEIVAPDDAKTLTYDNMQTTWVHSESHQHGRAIVHNLLHSVHSIAHNNQKFEYIDCGNYCVFPVHLAAFASAQRLHSVRSLCQISTVLAKPMIIIGDFNIRTFARYFVPLRNDRAALELLNSNFVDLSKHIINTSCIPLLKLDYAYCSSSIANRIRISKPHKTIKALDHYPLLLEIDESFK